MVPEGWKLSTFESHIDCLTGYAFKSSGYVNSDNGVKLLRGDNISPNGLRWREAKHWPEEGAEDLAKFQLHPGDFVIALDRTWISSGIKVAEVTPDDLPCLLVQRVARLRAKSSLEQGLLRHYFSGHRFTEYVKRSQTMTAVPHISPNDLKEFTFLLPTKPEQKKISEILSTWDKAITTTEQLLANSQQQKKALMQQLLTGKTRLLDKNGVRFTGEWKDTALSEMGRIVSGGTPDTKKDEYWGGTVSWLTPTDVTALKSRYVRATSRTITEKGVRASSATLLPAGSLMVCTRATVGAAAISTSEITTNQGFKSLIPSKQFDVEFIYYLLAHFNKKLTRKASGSTFLELSKRDFEKTSFKCPSLQEQIRISEALANADQELETLNKKLSLFKCEKQALMQQLLTGKRRVKVDEEAAA